MRLLETALILSLIFLTAANSFAAESDDLAQEAEVADLVTQLGAEEYADRDAATRKLIGIGLPALAAVERATEDPDPEIRFRAASIRNQLLPLIKEQVLQRFLRGEEGPATNLAGWDRFRETFGEDKKSRALFAEMYSFGRYRLTLLDEGKIHTPAEKIAGEPFADEDDEDLAEHPALIRRPKINTAVQSAKVKNGLPLGWIAVRVFIAGEPEAAMHPLLQREALAACFEPAWWEARDSEASGELVRKLTTRLIPLLAKDKPIVLALGARFGLRETLPFALDALDDKRPKQPFFALFPIVAFGESSHLPLVEKLLDDQRPALANNNETMEIQVRDAALATTILLSKKEIRDYFPKRKKDLPDDPLELLATPMAIGFVNEKQRDATHERWWGMGLRERPPTIKALRADRNMDDEGEELADPFDPFK